MNEGFGEYGMERLYWTARAAQGNTSAEIVRAIKDSLLDHAGGTPQFDDITLVVMKRTRR
jgi:sigma-B regulation protein RsbU (phosphoserine phosphatase)